MTDRRKPLEDFDEAEFIDSFKARPKSAPPPTPAAEKPPAEPTEKCRGRKSRREEYQTTFFGVKGDISPRLCKTITIRPEYHRKILQIVNVIANEEITIFNYIDNVLAHHLKYYDEDMTDLFNDRSPFKLKKQ